MRNKKILIIGSGASAISAAREFAKNEIAIDIIDIGHTPNKDKMKYSNRPYSQEKLAPGFENKYTEQYLNSYFRSLPFKLRTGSSDFVTRGVPNGKRYFKQGTFQVIQSFAKGGLCNSWGAGAFRFEKKDFRFFPYSLKDLMPFYEDIEEHIGISGPPVGDLEVLGKATQPPVQISPAGKRMLRTYKFFKKLNKSGSVRMDLPRLAVLTKDLESRKRIEYLSKEVWEQPQSDCIYNPKFTLRELISKGLVRYIDNTRVLSISKHLSNKLFVHTVNIRTDEHVSLEYDYIFLGAGAINSAEIISKSLGININSFRIIDNKSFFLPVLNPYFYLRKNSHSHFSLTQLICRIGDNLQGSFIDISTVPASELIKMMPFSLSTNMELIKFAKPMLMASQWYSETLYSDSLAIQDLSNAKKNIYPNFKNDLYNVSKGLLKHGIPTIPFVAKKNLFGHAIHYGGTMPYKTKLTESAPVHTCSRNQVMKNVYILDSSSFPSISEKNFTLTLMAHAARVVRVFLRRGINE